MQKACAGGTGSSSAWAALVSDGAQGEVAARANYLVLLYYRL